VLACLWCFTVSSGRALAVEPTAAPHTDDRALAAACDGVSDAGPALQAAYDRGASNGGGSVVLPSGRTCRIGTPVAARSGVDLRCSPGARLVADVAAGAAFTGSDLRAASVEGCDVIVAAAGGSAMDLSGVDLRLEDTRIDTRASPGQERPLVRLACAAGGSCRVSGSRIACTGPAAAQGRALEVSVGEDGRASVRDNAIRGCLSGVRVSGRASIAENTIEATGDSSVALEAHPSRSGSLQVSRNDVRIAGRAAKGIAIVGWQALVEGNDVTAAGEQVRAFAIQGGEARFVGNAHQIAGVNAVGYELSAGSGVVIDSCTGRAGEGAAGQVHVSLVDTQQVVVSNCLLRRGDYGVAQDVAQRSSLNVTVDANRMVGMSAACVVATTGFSVTDNYCAWLDEGAVALVLGDDRPPGGENLHAVVTGNLLHCMACRALIVPTSAGGRCEGGPARPCRQPSDCPPRRGASGGRCLPPRIENIVVANNQFLGVRDGVGIDFGAADGPAVALAELMIEGNQFSMRGACTAIRFPPASETRPPIRNVAIGENVTACPTYLSGFEEATGRAGPEPTARD
jgi:hypothetical protein